MSPKSLSLPPAPSMMSSPSPPRQVSAPSVPRTLGSLCGVPPWMHLRVAILRSGRTVSQFVATSAGLLL